LVAPTTKPFPFKLLHGLHPPPAFLALIFASLPTPPENGEERRPRKVHPGAVENHPPQFSQVIVGTTTQDRINLCRRGAFLVPKRSSLGPVVRCRARLATKCLLVYLDYRFEAPDLRVNLGPLHSKALKDADRGLGSPAKLVALFLSDPGHVLMLSRRVSVADEKVSLVEVYGASRHHPSRAELAPPNGVPGRSLATAAGRDTILTL